MHSRDARPEGFTRRSWHRKASKPVSYWLIALVIAVAAHPLIPQFRWLLVHMVTLGLVTTSIMIWGQHFTEALLKTRLGEETRPKQVARIWALTASIIIAMAGMLANLPLLTVLGAIGVSAMILWYAFALGAQLKAALAPRFAFVVRAYLIAACLLPFGAALGAILAFSPGEPWQGRLLLAHQVVNILGFVGVTVSATLLTLWPTVLRTKLDTAKATRASRFLIVMVIGTLVAMLGALVDNVLVGLAGLTLYILGQVVIGLLLVALARQSSRQMRREPVALFPVLSIGAGALWFLGTCVALWGLWFSSIGSSDGSPVTSPLNFSLTAARLHDLSVPFVAGFLLQLLLGAMSYLLPASMGGGPRALKAGLAVMSRWAVFRVVALNLALGMFAFASITGTIGDALFGALTFGTFAPSQFGSVTRVLVSAVAFVVLAFFIVLMLRMVKVNLRERLEFTERSAQLGMPVIGAPAKPQQSATSGSAPTATASGVSSTPALAHEGKARREPATLGRRHLTSALAGAGTVFSLAAVGRAFDGTLAGAAAVGTPTGRADSASGAGPAIAPTGRTTRLKVEANAEMRFVPNTLEVPAGDRLEIEVHNVDPANTHDLVLDTGAHTVRLHPGDTVVLEAGVVTAPIEGWCSIVGHRAMGMTLTITPTGARMSGSHSSDGGAAGVGTDPLARVTADLTSAPGSSRTRRDPVVPAVPSPGTPQKLAFTVTEENLEIAPGIAMESMVYNGEVMGPVLTSPLGGKIDLTLTNSGEMGHSIDFHAGTVAPNRYMRTIAPGESLTYSFTTDYAGAWLYHCSTAPMTMHLSGGMFGILIVPPQGLAPADREYVLVQSEHYLAPEASTGTDGQPVQGPDGTSVHAISSEKIFAERPDFTVFNGQANQYVHEPLEAKVGERVRIWVLAAGPSRGIAFHVVGTVFDTVFKEGEYLLRPDNTTGGGAQALDLGSCQGGFVEMVFHEEGTYKAVNHQFVDLERGALALIHVTA
ncbi:multicopper oxidase domain-containing protein [Dermabacter sp. Marseille-Q3180]|uniref:multicopper oxidase domain-containing protein n=1 Tax=Dermabacter sp. Marseille-Q3180 TaxID=2758090 RepID=UPI00202448C7|nr:multicopper oxidase domain-containing protein [Dermabacter sp. Marseille-Q3180]